MKILRGVRLFIGIFLFLVSVLLCSKMIMEKAYDWEMEKKYKVTELNEMYKGVPTLYQFANSQINVYHKINENESYIDRWDYKINLADIYISINGETREVLRNYPVRVGLEGLNQYTHYLSYWIVLNKETKKQSFVIVLQKNGANERELPNGDIEGFVPKEKLQYLSLTIHENGEVTKDRYSYESKNKLQTKLIPPMNYGGAGYYTDAWYSYPVFFFPITYPFLTVILGLILILFSIPFKVLFNIRKSR